MRRCRTGYNFWREDYVKSWDGRRMAGQNGTKWLGYSVLIPYVQCLAMNRGIGSKVPLQDIADIAD